MRPFVLSNMPHLNASNLKSTALYGLCPDCSAIMEGISASIVPIGDCAIWKQAFPLLEHIRSKAVA
jgi:hypothetical protein